MRYNGVFHNGYRLFMMTFKRLIRYMAFLLAIGFTLPVYAHETESFHLKNGDLIFQEDCGDLMTNAIKAATKGIKGYQFTHVGMVWLKSPDDIQVIEATPPEVTVTPLADYLSPEHHCTPRSVVGRLKNQYQKLIPQAITAALQKVGKGYDYAFNINNDQYYCSELIYQAFKEANQGKALFPLTKMTFKSKRTGQFPVYWVMHFRELNIPIPEGELGNNPADMSRSPLIKIVHYYPESVV